MPSQDTTYSPAQVAEMFNVSKSTLYRWEREGKLPRPARDLRGRQYGREELRVIAQLAEIEPLKRRIHQVYELDDPAATEALEDLAEKLSLDKFVMLHDLTGLYELAERPKLKSETIRRLLQEALQYEPTDEVFKEIIRIIHSKSNSSSSTDALN